jgi:hypothetical protein
LESIIVLPQEVLSRVYSCGGSNSKDSLRSLLWREIGMAVFVQMTRVDDTGESGTGEKSQCYWKTVWGCQKNTLRTSNKNGKFHPCQTARVIRSNTA